MLIRTKFTQSICCISNIIRSSSLKKKYFVIIFAPIYLFICVKCMLFICSFMLFICSFLFRIVRVFGHIDTDYLFKLKKNLKWKKIIVCYCWTMPIYDLRRSVTKKKLKINYIILENDRKKLKKKYKNSKNNKKP